MANCFGADLPVQRSSYAPPDLTDELARNAARFSEFIKERFAFDRR
jgi:hypothetical protein